VQKTAIIFVSNAAGGQVVGYSEKTLKPVAYLGGPISGPAGISVDRAGNVYVANSGAADVLFYPASSSLPTRILNDSNWYPSDVCVSPTGEVAVTNDVGGVGADIAFYRKGEINSFKSISSSVFFRMFYCAYDAVGNTYVDGQDYYGGAHVGFIAGGGAGNSIADLNIDGIGLSAGLAVMRSGDILVEDESSSTIHEYQADSNDQLRTIALEAPSNYFIATFALMKGEKLLWAAVSGPAGNGNDGFAQKDPFPNGIPPIQTITGLATPLNGIAVTPADLP